MTDNTTDNTTDEMNLYYEAYYGSPVPAESGAEYPRNLF